MKNNIGQTKIRTKRRTHRSLREFDGLPKNLREWLRNAALPWRPSSIQNIYNRVLADTGNPRLALAELDRRQEILLSKDRKI